MTSLHRYAHPLQEKAAVALAVAAVCAAWATSAATEGLQWKVPWWLDAPAALGWYGLLASAFDRVGWRWTLFRRLHGVLDLSGSYAVRVRSSDDGHKRSVEGEAIVSQTWTRMSVRITFPGSSSVSRTAVLEPAPDGGARIVYTYDNDPRASASASMHPHRGTAVLEFDASRRGAGDYYSGRGRTTFGELAFEPASA